VALGIRAFGVSSSSSPSDEGHLDRWIEARWRGQNALHGALAIAAADLPNLVPGTLRVISARMNDSGQRGASFR